MSQPTGADALTTYILGNSHLVSRPQVVGGLASSGATFQQAGAVNQFIAGNTNQSLVTAHSAVGDPNVPQTQQIGEPSAPEPKPDGGWSFGRVLHDLTHNPVTNVIGQASNFVNAGIGTAASLLDGHPSQLLDSIHQQMGAAGYDSGNFFSTVAFMSSGQMRLDLTDLQNKTDPDMFSFAEHVANIGGLHDKSAFGALQNQILNDPSLEQAQKDQQIKQLYSKDFQDLVAQISVRKSTFGNWAFEGRDPNSKLETALAGATDFAVSLKTDPTIVAGNVYRAKALSKITLDNMADTDTVWNVLTGVTQGVKATNVRRGVQTLIDNTNALRDAAKAGDEAGIAVATRNIRTLTPDLQHLAGEFAGGQPRAVGIIKSGENKGDLLWGKAKPITDMTQAATYLSDEAGVARLMSGRAQAEIGIMPGQLGRYGATAIQRNLRAYVGAKATKAGINSLQMDLANAGVVGRIIPSYGDRVLVSNGKNLSEDLSPKEAKKLASQVRGNAVAIGQQQVANRAGFDTLEDYQNAGTLSRAAHSMMPGAVAARGKLLANRLSSMLNKTDTFSTADPELSEKVLRYGQLYLTRSHSLLLAGAAAVGNEGTQKAIINGMGLSVLHAAGLGTSDAGLNMIKKFSREFSGNRYSITGSTYRDPTTGLTTDSAIWDGQLNDAITLPSFNQIRQLAAKTGVWENTVGRVLNTQLVSEITNLDRWTWLLRPAGAVRNIAEELAGVWGRSETGATTVAHLAQSLTGTGPARLKISDKMLAPLARLSHFYQQVGVNHALDNPKLGMKYQLEDADALQEQANKYMNIQLRTALDPAADLADIVRSGYRPGRVKMVRSGFGEVDPFDVTGDTTGAEAFAHNLSVAVDSNPKLFSKLIDHLQDPNTTTFEDVVDHLRKGQQNAKFKRTSVFRDEVSGVDTSAATKTEKATAATQHAQILVNEAKHLLTRRGSDKLNTKLASYIKKNGQGPDFQWIADNIKAEHRPDSVLAPIYEAMPTEAGKKGFLGMASDIAGKGYEKLVVRPIDRWTTVPVFRANYGKMRAFMEPWQQELVAGGLKPKVADEAAKRMGMQMAWTRTMKYVDNAEMRTQMDAVGRSFFAFSRATTAFMRRWGTQLVEDPRRMRRLMLAYEAGVNTGFLYDDANGKKQFVFPATGFALDAIARGFDAVPGIGGVYVPGASPNLTSQFQFLNSGLQNPAQFSLTPIANIPLKASERLFPSFSQSLNSIDGWINGSQGQGKSFWSQFEPSVIKNFTGALSDDQKDGLLADTVRAAMVTLGATKNAPGSQVDENGKPIPTDAAAQQKYLTNVTAQAKNILVGRAIFGFFAPAAPGVPTEDSNVGKSDWIYGALGIHNLSDEFKEIANEVGIDNAYVVWADIHPDKLMYTVGTTSGTVKSAEIQATEASQKWMTDNFDFMKDYAGVGAYFLPPAANQGEFNMSAYQSELELGLRQHKTTTDFYNDVVNANANQMYFNALDTKNKALAANPNNVDDINQQFADWKKDFNATHPLYASTQQDYSVAQSGAKDQLSQLRRMVAAKSLPSSVPRQTVSQMISAYDTYHSAIALYPRQTNSDTAARAAISGEYAQWMQQTVEKNPALGALYSGVFRTIDTSVLDPIGS